jgi:hypothetical protein
MKKYRYFSSTERKWYNIYAQIGFVIVSMLDGNQNDFGACTLAVWNAKKERGLVLEGWMDQYRYFSSTERKWYNVYAQIGFVIVSMMDENQNDFGVCTRIIWDTKKECGLIIEGWAD